MQAEVNLRYNQKTAAYSPIGDLPMTDSSAVFVTALEGSLANFDLLKHPYYQAWSNWGTDAR